MEYIEIHEEDNYFMAKLVKVSKVRRRKKNSCKKIGSPELAEEVTKEPEVENEEIAEIRCSEKVGLTLVRNALEEA